MGRGSLVVLVVTGLFVLLPLWFAWLSMDSRRWQQVERILGRELPDKEPPRWLWSMWAGFGAASWSSAPSGSPPGASASSASCGCSRGSSLACSGASATCAGAASANGPAPAQPTPRSRVGQKAARERRRRSPVGPEGTSGCAPPPAAGRCSRPDRVASRRDPAVLTRRTPPSRQRTAAT
jgi:hypothetical protein